MGETNSSPSAGGMPSDGARAFLLSRIHPAIWVSCLGYFAPVLAPMLVGGGSSAQAKLQLFGLTFVSAAFLLIGGAFVALWRMNAQKAANPAGPHYAGRLVAFINIAMGIGAFILFIALPGGHSPIPRNESKAIYQLRELAAGQLQFHGHVIVDLDGDRKGEYGTLGELAGTEAVRGSGDLMAQSPYIAGHMAVCYPDTKFIKRSGYLFALYLPSKADGTLLHPPGGSSAPAVKGDADLQEQHWVAYAWPFKHDETGVRAFVVNQRGEVYACRNTLTKYSGPDNPPPPGAAYAPGESGANPLTATIGDAGNGPDAASKSADGEIWSATGK